MMKTCHQGSTSHQNHLFGHLSIDLMVGMMMMVTMVMMMIIVMMVWMMMMVMMVMIMMMIRFTLTYKRSSILVVIGAIARAETILILANIPAWRSIYITKTLDDVL